MWEVGLDPVLRPSGGATHILNTAREPGDARRCRGRDAPSWSRFSFGLSSHPGLSLRTGINERTIMMSLRASINAMGPSGHHCLYDIPILTKGRVTWKGHLVRLLCTQGLVRVHVHDIVWGKDRCMHNAILPSLPHDSKREPSPYG